MRTFVALRGLAVVVVVALALTLPAPVAHARAAPEALPEVALADLPGEARETLARIRAGGPFPYERDGVRFGNRERILPAMPRGHYREYTVKTPGVKTRGARRIVCGGPTTAPEACYYTHDHYQSFARIRE
jgi:ribonuclease T1